MVNLFKVSIPFANIGNPMALKPLHPHDVLVNEPALVRGVPDPKDLEAMLSAPSDFQPIKLPICPGTILITTTDLTGLLTRYMRNARRMVAEAPPRTACEFKFWMDLCHPRETIRLIGVWAADQTFADDAVTFKIVNDVAILLPPNASLL
jgi:hypothetical protein